MTNWYASGVMGSMTWVMEPDGRGGYSAKQRVAEDMREKMLISGELLDEVEELLNQFGTETNILKSDLHVFMVKIHSAIKSYEIRGRLSGQILPAIIKALPKNVRYSKKVQDFWPLYLRTVGG